MRSTGSVETAADLELNDHLCWAYADPDDFRSRVVEFLSEGLERGERVQYLADDDPSRSREVLTGIDGIESHLAAGRAQVANLNDVYPPGPTLAPHDKSTSTQRRPMRLSPPGTGDCGSPPTPHPSCAPPSSATPSRGTSTSSTGT